MTFVPGPTLARLLHEHVAPVLAAEGLPHTAAPATDTSRTAALRRPDG